MITEDYVSFELAKLLKEKGFDEPCYQYYLTTKTLHTTFHNRVWVEQEPFFNSFGLGGLYEVPDKTLFEEICSAPTLQMAMKWLREVHNLFIFISTWLRHKDGTVQYYYEIRNLKDEDFEPLEDFETLYDYTSEELNSVEKACEAAIKYCLENLI